MDEPQEIQNPESHAPLPESRRQSERSSLLELQHELESLHHRLSAMTERLLGTIAPDGEGAGSAHVEPDMDIYENDQEFLIHAALPGVAPHAIRIETTAHTVTLSAERPITQQSVEQAASSQRRHRRSRYAGQERFHFVYTLHAAIVPEMARAEFRHGMVEIHLPKVRSAPRSVSIPVHLYQEAAYSHAVASPAQISPPYDLPSVSPLPVHSREGNPTSKMGLAYVPSAGEDHTSKAQSTGDYRPPRTVRMTTPPRMAPESPEIPDEPAAMEARAAGEKL